MLSLTAMFSLLAADDLGFKGSPVNYFGYALFVIGCLIFIIREWKREDSKDKLDKRDDRSTLIDELMTTVEAVRIRLAVVEMELNSTKTELANTKTELLVLRKVAATPELVEKLLESQDLLISALNHQTEVLQAQQILPDMPTIRKPRRAKKIS